MDPDEEAEMREQQRQEDAVFPWLADGGSSSLGLYPRNQFILDKSWEIDEWDSDDEELRVGKPITVGTSGSKFAT